MRGKYLKVLKDIIRDNGFRWLYRQGVKYFKILLSARQRRAFTGPVSCTVMLTYRCNHRCTMCDFPARAEQDKREMDTKRVKNLLSEIASLPASGISFYGGEPLLRKDLVQLVSYARNLGLVTHVTTNGYLLTRKLARKLIEAGVNLITISLDGCCQETHDFQRGRKGAFEHALKAIQNVLMARNELSSRTKLAVTTTLTSRNIGEIGDIVELVHDLGVDSYTVFEAQCIASLPDFFGSKERDKLLKANQQLQQFKKKYPSLIDNTKVYLSIVKKILSGKKAHLKCFAPYTDLFIDPYGNIFPCNYFLGMNEPAGKLKPGKLKEFWYSHEYQMKRNALANCGICNYMCHRELSLIFNRFWPFPKPEISLPGFNQAKIK